MKRAVSNSCMVSRAQAGRRVVLADAHAGGRRRSPNLYRIAYSCSDPSTSASPCAVTRGLYVSKRPPLDQSNRTYINPTPRD
eukprot:5864022-Prymnesium_polylepis.1